MESADNESAGEINVNMDEHFAQIAHKLTELEHKIEHVETTLLTEFHKWSSPNEMRQRTHAAAIRALDTEIENHEDRIKALEGHQQPGH
jgi:hypothetical protein